MKTLYRLFLALCLAACACGTSDGGSDATDGTVTPGTDVPTADPGTTDPGTADPGTTDPGTTTGGTYACNVPENHDCMEFSGLASDALLKGTETICTSGGGQWTAGACPKGALGACDVPRGDGVKQTVLCYDKEMGIPPADQIGYCKQACTGTFTQY